jgi:hypothetical protein
VNWRSSHPASTSIIAIAHLGLDQLDDTFRWLDKAFEERSFWLISLNVEPKFDSVRQDPRFVAMHRRLGLPEVTPPENSQAPRSLEQRP